LSASSATVLSAPAANQTPRDRSRVVIAHRNDLRTLRNQINESAVCNMLSTALERFFNMPAADVWSTLFSPRDSVGLKVNCLAGKQLSTHQELVWAIVEELRRIGIPSHRIIIWDRRDRDLLRAGYELAWDADTVQCYGNDRAGFSRHVYEFGQAGSQISSILERQCTAVINLPVMKDHGIVGVSGGMKNFFGAINNPNKYHINVGDPFVADVNMFAPIREKHRLTICDAFTAQYEGGPPFMPDWAWSMDSLIVATDMVAMDQVIWGIIEEQRVLHNIETLKAAGREPAYIATAADDQHRLGTNQLDKINVIHV